MKVSTLFVNGATMMLGLLIGIGLTIELMRLGVISSVKQQTVDVQSTEAGVESTQTEPSTVKALRSERLNEGTGSKSHFTLDLPVSASKLSIDSISASIVPKNILNKADSTSASIVPENILNKEVKDWDPLAGEDTGPLVSKRKPNTKPKQIQPPASPPSYIIEMAKETVQVGEWMNLQRQQSFISGIKKKKKQGKSECPYNFSLYVYDLPFDLPSVLIAEQARQNNTLHICQKCILEQFALEYIVHDYFTQFCGRTYDPEEADFFYLPIIRDAEYRVTLDPQNKAMKGNRRAPSMTEQAILHIMEKGDSTLWRSYFNITDEYWFRKKGMDHIFVIPAPVTNFRHQSSMRGFFHYMPQLHNPIFLNLEFSQSFIAEYPICSRKNIVMPYPTTDPELFNGHLYEDPIERHSLVYYVGGMHGECVGIRKAIKSVMFNGTKIKASHITPKYRSTQKEREHGFRAATFCPVPIGDSPSSKRMYDVMHFGCIPVILSDELVYAFSNEAGGPLNESQYALRLPQSIIQFPTNFLLEKFGSPKAQKLFGYLPDGTSLWSLLKKAAEEPAFEEGVYINPLVHILRMISPANLKIYRENIKQIAPKYRYYQMDSNMKQIPTASHKMPNGEALKMLMQALSKKKKEGIMTIGQACEKERNQKHKYVGNYPCDKVQMLK